MFELLQIVSVVVGVALVSSALLAKAFVVFARQVASPAQPATAVDLTHQSVAARFVRRREEPVEDDSSASAESEPIEPLFRRNEFEAMDAAAGFGPMASSDYGNDLEIPTVIRNLSD